MCEFVLPFIGLHKHVMKSKHSTSKKKKNFFKNLKQVLPLDHKKINYTNKSSKLLKS